MLDALLAQTFGDFEIIISDNASTDDTAAICAEYASSDNRIRNFRQSQNIGAVLNFKFVLDKAVAPYFMWSACDDVRSVDFLEENVRFLDLRPDYVASTCPSSPDGLEPTGSNVTTFSLEGAVAERFHRFIDNCWVSNSIFFSVIRTDVLQGCDVIGEYFLGADWAVVFYLASRGNVNRTPRGLMVSGVSGISKQENAWRIFRVNSIYWIFPFYRVSIYALKLASDFSWAERIFLIKRLLKLNFWAAYSQFHSEFHPWYSLHLKSWIRKIKPRL